MKIDSLEPEFKSKVVALMAELLDETGYNWAITQSRRTIAYQDALFAQPTDGKDNDNDGRVDEPDEFVTRARGGQSAHNFDMGADLVPIKNGKEWWGAPRSVWLKMGEAAEKHGLVWGGRWVKLFPPNGDMPHIQDPKWKERQALWKAGKLDVA